MQRTNCDDPLRTTDHEPSAATTSRDATADFIPESPPACDETATHLPGQSQVPEMARLVSAKRLHD
jgi:hypothetical protein